jgi:hypothetical protein
MKFWSEGRVTRCARPTIFDFVSSWLTRLIQIQIAYIQWIEFVLPYDDQPKKRSGTKDEFRTPRAYPYTSLRKKLVKNERMNEVQAGLPTKIDDTAVWIREEILSVHGEVMQVSTLFFSPIDDSYICDYRNPGWNPSEEFINWSQISSTK